MYFGRKSGSRSQPAMTGMMNQPEMMGMMNQPDMMGMMNQPDMMGMMNQPDMMGMMNQPDMMGMMNQPDMMTGPAPGMPYAYQYEQQMNPEGAYATETEYGYACDPCGCMPYYEHKECHKPLPEIYVVQKGDTVYKIAQRYGLDWRELAGYNHLGNPDLIYPGERLFIPPR